MIQTKKENKLFIKTLLFQSFLLKQMDKKDK